MAALTNTAPSAGPSTRGFHRLALFATCPQKYAYHQLLRLEPIAPRPQLALGSLIHIALMYHYLRQLGRNDRDPIEMLKKSPLRFASHVQTAIEIYKAYAQHRPHEDSRRWTVLDVEREFEITISGELYTQRVDLVVLESNSVVFVDHKSTAGQLKTLSPEWSMSGQFAGYQVIGKALAEHVYARPFGGVAVNVVGTTPPYETRIHKLEIRTEVERDFLRAARQTQLAINAYAACDPLDYEKRGLVSGACMGRYGMCEYEPLCKYGRGAMSEFENSIDDATFVAQGSGS